MKTTTKLLIALGLLSAATASAAPVEEQKAWKDAYSVDTATPHLRIDNIWGGVKVRTGRSDQISVSAVERRIAPDRERFDRSFETIRLDIKADSNGVSFLVGDPEQRWHRMDECKGCRLDIQFEVLVPPGTTVDVGTVMDGRIEIQGVSGVVSASNVNGPVKVDGIAECRHTCYFFLHQFKCGDRSLKLVSSLSPFGGLIASATSCAQKTCRQGAATVIQTS